MSKKRALLSDSSDDEDLEEQLLSLSKKKKIAAPVQPDSDVSDDNDDSDTSTDDGDDDWSADGKSSKKKAKKKVKAKPVAKKRAISSSEEEGEINDDDDDEDEDEDEKKSDDDARASSGSSSSSSEDGSDDELQAFDDGLGEDLMGDEEDRKKLEQMTEVEREQELFNRMEKREALKTRREIQSKLHAERKKELKQSKKGKHKHKDDVYNGISGNKESRKKNVDDKKKSALDELKEKRQQKKEKMDALIKKKEPLKTNEVFSDDDDADDDDDKDKDGDSDKDKDKDDSSDSSDSSDNEDGSDKSEEEEEEPDVPLENISQLEQIRLSRHKLEQWVHLPFFNKVVIGCYVRMGIGQHEGRSVYRVAEIADVTETAKIYTIGKTKTNKGLRVKHGLQEKVYRMEYISNQSFTESEFNKWKDEMKSVELPLPMLKQIKSKAEEVNSSKNYQYKEDDIEEIIQEKAKFRKNPFNYAVKKNNLLIEKAIATQTMDYTKIESITTQLDDLEDRAVFLDKQRSGSLGNISFINERNRKTNVYAAEEAVIAESKKQKGEKEKNPFTRRRTIPTMITKGSALLEDQRKEKVETELEMTNRRKGLAAQANAQADQAESSSLIDSLLFTPSASKLDSSNVSEDSDLFNVHNFDVQIDVTIPQSRSLSLTPKPMVGQRDGIVRRSLNLDEYKKRKGLM